MLWLKLRIDRKRQEPIRDSFCYREITSSVSQFSVRLLKVNGNWIMNACSDTCCAECLLHLIAVLNLNRVDVVHVPAMRRWCGSFKLGTRQEAIVMRCDCLACLSPTFDIGHFYIQDGTLNSVHAKIIARQDMIVFRFLSPIAQQR